MFDKPDNQKRSCRYAVNRFVQNMASVSSKPDILNQQQNEESSLPAVRG